jgi:predicted nucleotidyltransferase
MDTQSKIGSAKNKTKMLHIEHNYKLEIVRALIKNSSHIREIAKKIKTNPMMINRKINLLLKENVVDFRNEGKNKIFFLKNSIEARGYVLMAEQYKLLKILEDHSNLRSIFEKIQKNKKVKLAILFGSYAKGIPKKNSDIDIYIETQDLNLKKELENFNSSLSVKIGKYNKNNNLIKEIEKNYIIIKGAEIYYEK